ncbi:PaaI family thioesterase [Kurthia sibirica]|uniref:PaaI family thioesterase n=1 Tax=Kurthia sibirica TaxID=202750 RepID=A0A2U3AQ28_9BACL|nr:PaaI family thioesterase [Kurthia sibirica]PWI26660.1 PaaI family thioesterase [Kurthia sibirica]GEK32925.1 hypothetical protein KSI01_04580 [Kurthia sibirica]
MKTLYELQEKVASGHTVAPIADLLGVDIVAVEVGKVTVAIDIKPEHYNPMGTLHGGVICDIADMAMGLTLFSVLEEGELFTTIELKLNFLKPIWSGRLTAEGRIIKKGKKIALLESTVVDEVGSIVAHSTSSLMIIVGDEEGRRTKI